MKILKRVLDPEFALPPAFLILSINALDPSGFRTVIFEILVVYVFWTVVKLDFLEEYPFFSIHRNYKYTFYLLLVAGGFVSEILMEKFGRAFSPMYVFVALTALVLGEKPARSLGLILSSVLAVHFSSNLWIFIEGVTITLATSWTLRKIYRRSEVVRSSGLVSLTILAVYVIKLLAKPDSVAPLEPYIAVLNPLVSTVVVLGVLPYIEYTSRIYSNIGLMELGNLNHPLLKLLSTRAPGTYQHSAIVANLAEAAAERIGANSLLARMASYFHDIGKVKRPYFFVENQAGFNPHDDITPSLSHLILDEHVKYGAKLARKYRLPILIECAIMEHHGTSVQKYFYHKAKEMGMNVSEDDFRYPGPKPRFKESGIIMLADSVEAASRVISGKSHSQIKAKIEEIVMSIFADRQLDNSGLTLEELEKITEEFVKFITSFYHHRVEYPKREDVVVNIFDAGDKQER